MLTGLGQRLRIVRKSFGLTQKEAASLVGASLRTWQDWEAERTTPNGRVFAVFCQMGVDANWMVSGIGDMRKAQAQVSNTAPEGGWKLLDSRYDKLFGDTWHPLPHFDSPEAPPEDPRRHAVALTPGQGIGDVGGSPEGLATVEVTCDAMQPDMNPGDLVVLDTKVREIAGNGTYVLNHTGKLVVRKVEHRDDGSVSVSGLNPGTDEQVYAAPQAGGLDVRGRVVMKIQRLDG